LITEVVPAGTGLNIIFYLITEVVPAGTGLNIIFYLINKCHIKCHYTVQVQTTR